jgi:hypothetical protein
MLLLGLGAEAHRPARSPPSAGEAPRTVAPSSAPHTHTHTHTHTPPAPCCFCRPQSPGPPEDLLADHQHAGGAAGGGGSGQQQPQQQQGGLTSEQEAALKHRSTKNWWEVAQREVDVKEQSRKLAQLEGAFGQIQAETGIGSIEEMVSAFVSTEDRNYAVLTMVNDLNREIEAAEVENAGLRAAVEHARTEGSTGQAGREGLYKDWEGIIAALSRRT